MADDLKNSMSVASRLAAIKAALDKPLPMPLSAAARSDLSAYFDKYFDDRPIVLSALSFGKGL